MKAVPGRLEEILVVFFVFIWMYATSNVHGKRKDLYEPWVAKGCEDCNKQSSPPSILLPSHGSYVHLDVQVNWLYSQPQGWSL